MSYKIMTQEKLAPAITRMTVLAPDIVRNALTGQFIVIIPEARGERVPLTIVEADKSSGVLTVIFQGVGFSTCRMSQMKPGDSLFALLGPLGKPTHVEKFGRVICVGGGVGIAEMLPVARAMKEGGNRVTGIVGARSKNILILEHELKRYCDDLLVTTDDGSRGRKGFVTDVLEEELKKGGVSYVYAVGPVPMMKKVAETARPYGVRTVVSLNPLMVDATGMCGACRCHVGGRTVFGCIDGPEFDAQEVDFDELAKRLAFFKEEEAAAGKAVPCRTGAS